jgi:hypothetical protein
MIDTDTLYYHLSRCDELRGGLLEQHDEQCHGPVMADDQHVCCGGV